LQSHSSRRALYGQDCPEQYIYIITY
jgi:hypothetical protein